MCYQYLKALRLFSKKWILSSNQCIVCISCEIKRDRCPESLSIISKVKERNPDSSQLFFKSSKEYRLNYALVWFHVNQVSFPRLFDNKVKAHISEWTFPRSVSDSGSTCWSIFFVNLTSEYKHHTRYLW